METQGKTKYNLIELLEPHRIFIETQGETKYNLIE